MKKTEAAVTAVKSALSRFIEQHPAVRYCLAYSGGLDSSVLLHVCAQLARQQPRLTIHAVHIDHGLQAAASEWAEHCMQQAQAYSIAIQVIPLSLDVPRGASLEQVAREARYQAFAELLIEGEVLLTAHHQDDQAETLLLNLFRGSGVHGLAAMPVIRPIITQQQQIAFLGRPLMNVSRAQLRAYASYYGLVYQEDPSNADSRFDRNYLRHQLLPIMRQRWPAVSQTLARAAQWQAEQKALLDLLLEPHLVAVQGQTIQTLSLCALNQQPLLLRKALLRQWLMALGFQLPSAAKLQQVIDSLLTAGIDKQPCVHWTGCEIRRYQDDLYAIKPLSLHDSSQVLFWPTLEKPLFIPSLERVLTRADLEPLAAALAGLHCPLTVRFRQGGERIKRRQGNSLRLKHILQDYGVPPWLRDRLPLVYVGDQLVAVVGVYQLSPNDLFAASN